MEAALENIHRCFRCGYCKYTDGHWELNCPAYLRKRFETYSSGGRLWLLRAWLRGEVEWTPRLGDVVYACTTCRNCVEQCPFKFRDMVIDMVVAGRREMVERGLVPAKVKEFLENLQRQGNPWGLARERRAKWLSEVGAPIFTGREDFLLYLGCLASYDNRAAAAAKALIALLKQAGASFGVFGAEEVCDGHEAYLLGEQGLFELLAESNWAKFQELGVKEVVALSPHALHAFTSLYPRLGFEVKTRHYTQALIDALRQGRLTPGELKVRAALHDPCYLGRHLGLYEPPRAVLRFIPGLELIELARSRERALCCGGGSGHFYFDLLAGAGAPAKARVRDALEAGVEVLAVACPACLVMLDSAVKEEGLEGELLVKDVAELLAEACGLA